jgi:hypothetical protein
MTQSKLRLNADIRKKIGGMILSHFENEKTTELENFKSAKEDITTAYDRAFKLATKVVQKAYPKDDVATLQTFKKKYGSACDVVAKDSCFYFAKIEKETDDIKANDTNAEHFSFKLDSTMQGRFSDYDFGIAYFRDELKNAGLNPEINITQRFDDKSSNPYWTQEMDKIKKFLGFNYDDDNSIKSQWDNKYSLDVIGTSYCRSRTIPCTIDEFNQMKMFKLAKDSFVNAHFTWAEMIHKDMRDITLALKDYKYVKDAIDLCGALGLDISENELQRTAGVSLTIYQPENLASLIKSRRAKQDNKSVIAQFKKARQSAVATH